MRILVAAEFIFDCRPISSSIFYIGARPKADPEINFRPRFARHKGRSSMTANGNRASGGVRLDVADAYPPLVDVLRNGDLLAQAVQRHDGAS